MMIDPTTAPGIESKPPITTAGNALNADMKLNCDKVLNPPVMKETSKGS